MQGRTGRDNVVDHKYRHTGNIRTRREFGRIESLSSAETGLGHRSSAPIEQSATGQAELACNGACDLFTLVEPAVAAALGIRRGPGDRLQIGTAAAFCVDAAATLLWLCMRALITLAAASVINLPAGRSMRTQ